jgi:hypothetical protein
MSFSMLGASGEGPSVRWREKERGKGGSETCTKVTLRYLLRTRSSSWETRTMYKIRIIATRGYLLRLKERLVVPLLFFSSFYFHLVSCVRAPPLQEKKDWCCELSTRFRRGVVGLAPFTVSYYVMYCTVPTACRGASEKTKRNANLYNLQYEMSCWRRSRLPRTKLRMICLDRICRARLDGRYVVCSCTPRGLLNGRDERRLVHHLHRHMVSGNVYMTTLSM